MPLDRSVPTKLITTSILNTFLGAVKGNQGSKRVRREMKETITANWEVSRACVRRYMFQAYLPVRFQVFFVAETVLDEFR